MKQKINLRLALIALIAVLATTLGLTLVYYNLFETRVRTDLRSSAELLSESELFQSIYAGEDEAGGKSALERLESDSLRITWVAADGTVLYDNDTDASSMGNHLDRPEIEQAMEEGSGESMRTSDTMKMNTFYYALLLDDGTVLRVSTQARSITSVFFSAAPVILLISLVILALCILLGHYLTAQIVKPINDMAEHLDDSIESPTYKELEPFARKIRQQHESILAAATSRQDFTANVSHELKTPLTAISGYAELLENRMVDADREVYIAGQIRHNSERLLSLINDIIKLSELDHTLKPRKNDPVDLYALAEECCGELQINAQQRSVSLECTGSPAQVSGDRDLLRELLENLIQNAIRYNRENGRVMVRTAEENGHAVLSVSDTGIGIPKESQSRIFERFYRVDKSRSRETGGTGLGLAIVKHIAEIHSAQIRLESEPDKGTTITVTF